MSIVLAESHRVSDVKDYFYFNQIPHEMFSVFVPDSNGRGGDFTLNQQCLNNSDITLILDVDEFEILANDYTTKKQIIDFCQRGNNILVWNGTDGINILCRMSTTLIELDKSIKVGNLIFFVDGVVSPGSMLTQLENIKIKSTPWSWFAKFPDVYDGDVEKSNCTNDYLLTMIKKPGAVHRDILWNELNSRTGLINRGCVSYQTKKDTEWIGSIPIDHPWRDIFPSMDLYRNVWFEIVPETRYSDAWYLTEKTIKPIATKTPFVILTTAGYLEHLKDLGFQTFSSVIDESYDLEPDLETRTKMLVDQVENIIAMGSQTFYARCQDILKYNQRRLFEISGRKLFDTRSFIRQEFVPLLKI